MNKQWELRSDEPIRHQPICELAEQLGVSVLTAGLLWNRGICDSESATRFLSHQDSIFYDPYLLPDMGKAVDRIEAALAAGEKIAVYGDYDVDGVTATSLLYLYLNSRGAVGLCYYIPSRTGEGYGVNVGAIDRLAEDGVRLIVTVDTGVTAVEETRYAAERGIDLVITDHHECPAILPDAVAVVNPMRCDIAERYPFPPLAGVGVAFKLVSAMEKRRRGENADYLSRICAEYTDLVAIGTISDVMPLMDENRLFVGMGLHRMNQNPRLALRFLLEEASGRTSKSDLARGSVTSSTIGFTIGPRINAAGRMEHANQAMELFLSTDEQEIRRAATRLCEINRARQEEENAILEQAVEQIEAMDRDSDRKILVIAHEGWNPGVIGIVASKITERYGLPSILVAFDGEEGKGSGRSVKGLNLVDALSDSGELLTRFGGHELAAGLTVEKKNFPAFVERISAFAALRIGEQGCLTPRIVVDFPVLANDLTLRQADELRILEPYGSGNPSPIFLLRGARVDSLTELAGKHTKLRVRADGISLVALMFGSPRKTVDIVPSDTVDLVFQLSLNEFRSTRSVQLIVKDYRTHGVQIDDADRRRLFEILSGQSFEKSENLLPCRDEFAQIYLYLKHRIANARDPYISSRELLASCPDIGYLKLHLILEVLLSTGLVALGGGSVADDLAIYQLPQIRRKVDLEKAELYLKFRSQMR